MSCFCGAQAEYGQCCQPLHQGQVAPSVAALMRSRYSAFVLGLDAYLLTSWAPQTRPAALSLADQPEWKRLELLEHAEDGECATVLFRATGLAADGWCVLEERSRFIRHDGHWCYLDGDCQHHALSPGRNDPCPCGSGKKLKKCCL